jgi:hypothetical protein
MSLPLHAQVIQMGTAGWVTSILYAAAELGLADHLDTPKTAAEIAGALQADPRALHRLMRTLVSLGILSGGTGNRFSLTPLGATLKSNAPGSARPTLRTIGGPAFTRGFENIVYSVKTGKTGFEKAHGKPLFNYLASHPHEASMFSETMVGFHGGEPPEVAAAYDFSTFGTVVDVGGATGNMLAAILTKFAKPHGVLFDRAQVVAGAPALLKAAGVLDRVKIEGGDFFQSVPSGGDAYILSHILHDWSEEQCLTILRNIRKAMNPNGRVLIIEMVLPPDDSPHPGKILDMVMMVIPGGEERTDAEYASLLEKAGFRLQRVVPTKSAVSIVEATAV